MATVTLKKDGVEVTIDDGDLSAEECLNLAINFVDASYGAANARLAPSTPRSQNQDCMYADKTYSPGSVIKMPDGTFHECKEGEWRETGRRSRPDDS